MLLSSFVHFHQRPPGSIRLHRRSLGDQLYTLSGGNTAGMTSKAFPKGVFNTRTWRRIVILLVGRLMTRSKHAQTRNAKETPRISLFVFSMGWGSFRSQVQHVFVICTQLCEMSNVCAKATEAAHHDQND